MVLIVFVASRPTISVFLDKYLNEKSNNISRRYRKFGGPIVYTDTGNLFTKTKNTVWNNAAHSLIVKTHFAHLGTFAT